MSEWVDQIIQGDCLAVLPTLPAQSVDMILVDLPYGNNKTLAKWDHMLPMDALWEQYKRIINPRGVIVFTAVQPFTSLVVTSNLSWYRHDWVWCKDRVSGFLAVKLRPLREHEDIIVFSPHASPYCPIMQYRPRKDRTGKSMDKSSIHWNTKTAYHAGEYIDVQYPRTVLYFPLEVKQSDHIHPTQKPVALFDYLIRTYTQPGQLVLDHCAGSMTTAVAAIGCGRHFCCIEQDATYYTKGLRRVQYAQRGLWEHAS